MPRPLARLLAGFLLFAAAPAVAGPYLFPPSPNKVGDTVMVVQWCDAAADMQAVADTHAVAGKPAADDFYLDLVQRDRCHLIPTEMPTTGTLIEQHGFAHVMIAVPMVEQAQRAVVEVWSAAVDGIEGRAVYITLAHWATDEGI